MGVPFINIKKEKIQGSDFLLNVSVIIADMINEAGGKACFIFITKRSLYSRMILVMPSDAPPSAFIMLTRRSISFCGSLISSAMELESTG